MQGSVFAFSQMFQGAAGIRVRRRPRKYWPDTPAEPERLSRREMEDLFRDQLDGLRRGDPVRRAGR
jgi:hypothetical protein